MEEIELIRDPARYVAHPHMARLADGSWLLVATSAPRRRVVLHPPLDPAFVNIAIRSEDEGRSWSAPAPVPGPGVTGVECAGLTALPDGGVLLNQWRFRWYEDGVRPDRAAEPLFADAAALRAALAASADLDACDGAAEIRWGRGGGVATTCRSADGGRSWSAPVVVATEPYAGGYGMRGGVVLPDGTIVLPLSDAPLYRQVFVVRSGDGGRGWGPPIGVAALPSHEFEEPAPLLLDGTRILMLLRENVSRRLFAVRSDDGGLTWTPPRPTGIDGYPAHLLRLADGRIAAIVGRRIAPGSIRIHLSADEGASWHDQAPIRVADDLGTRDLGYPTGVALGGSRIFVAYYRRDVAGITGLVARIVDVDAAARPADTKGGE